ncbi:30S ribosomal protein S9 [Candidatus Parcubacteria bacterium]|nr:MAG: 30S ribosomal protein S9 [Candidatus Parcubacteria bacterium]
MAHEEKKVKEGGGKKYVEGLGRRKTAIARVRLSHGRGSVSINEKGIEAYFPLERLRSVVRAPLSELKLEDKFDALIHAKGGGLKAQAEAARLGLSRALVLLNPELKKRLRKFGFLTRDSRMVERKKYGLKKARRAPQWQKR